MKPRFIAKSIDKTFQAGNTIGSADSDTFHLEPEDGVSSGHAKVICDNGDLLLEATSYPRYPIHTETGGAKQPAGRVKLTEGCKFWIGSNRFEVRGVPGLKIPPVSRPEIREKQPLRQPPDVPSMQYYFPGSPLYRIAIIGTKDAGKTTFLSTLDMQMVKRSLEIHSVARISSLEEPIPARKDLTQADRKHNEQASKEFNEGDKLLKRAVEKLKNNELPEPTRQETETVRHVFKISTSKRTEILVETVDYAGEFVRLIENEKSENLRGMLNLADALIVLAPVPMPGYETQEELHELRELTKIFQTIKGRSSNPVPVVLLLNKWDRLAAYDPDSSDTKSNAKLLKNILKTTEYGKAVENLANSIKAIIGSDNFTMESISALGKCQLIEDANGEQSEQLPSTPGYGAFGVVEPFLWLVDRADRLAVRKYGRNVSMVSWWFPLHLVDWLITPKPDSGESSAKVNAIKECRDVARNLAYRKLPQFGLRCKIGWHRMRFRARQIAAVFQLLAIAAAVALMAEWQWSSDTIRDARETVSSKVADVSSVTTNALDDILVAESVLKAYTNSPRHLLQRLFFGRDEAAGLVADSRATIEADLLVIVTNRMIALRNRHDAAKMLYDYNNSYANRYEDIKTEHMTSLQSDIMNTSLPRKLRKAKIDEHRAYFRDVDIIGEQSIDQIERSLDSADEIQKEILRFRDDDKYNEMATKLLDLKASVSASERADITRVAENGLTNRLLPYVNSGLRDGKIDNTKISILHDSVETLKDTPEFYAIRNALSGALDRLVRAKSDYDLYDKVRYANTVAERYVKADNYLEAVKKEAISGFMANVVSNFIKKPQPAQITIQPDFKDKIKNGSVSIYVGGSEKPIIKSLADGKPKRQSIDIELTREDKLYVDIQVRLDRYKADGKIKFFGWSSPLPKPMKDPLYSIQDKAITGNCIHIDIPGAGHDAEKIGVKVERSWNLKTDVGRAWNADGKCYASLDGNTLE